MMLSELKEQIDRITSELELEKVAPNTQKGNRRTR